MYATHTIKPSLCKTALFGAIFVFLLTGCNKTIQPEPRQPVKLVNIANPQVGLQTVFTADIGSNTGLKRQLPQELQVAVNNNTLLVAHGTTVQAINSSGKLWSVNIGEMITSAVGFDASSQTAIIGTNQGKIIALNASTGDIRWQQTLKTTVLTPAIIAGNRVLLSANDGVLYGLNLQSGAIVWRYNTQSADISVRGTAKPLRLDANTAIFATADGRIYALIVDTGQLAWTRRVGVAVGGGDAQRMSDVDGTPFVDGTRLYVTSFSGQFASFDLTTGRTLFMVRDFATTKPVVALQGTLFGVDKDGMVFGFNGQTGEKIWQNNALMHRKPSNPVVIGGFVAIGDYDGVVHLFNKKGDLVGRTTTKGQINSLYSQNNRLYAQTQNGQVLVWQLQ